MEVELFTEEMSEDENYVLDDKIEDYLDVEGERCGICMEIVVDRGVLDCCQHWFCFECIDNWATITSLCPLCQNEFQLITCLPVYDTVGGNKTDEDTTPRDEDWFIEGNSNSLSFPAYYIDENAVVCLDGDGCKIRSASVAIEEDSDVDTSIACDSCDKWYHAFCVGFDPDGTCDSSWLCPRCLVDKVPLKLDQYSLSLLLQSHQNGLLGASGGSRVGDSLPEKVTVSIADVGETAVVVSLVEEHQKSRASRESALGCSENMKLKNTLSSSSTLPESEPLLDARNSTKQNSGQQEVGLSSSQKSNNSSSDSISTAQQNIYADDGDDRVTEHSNSKSVDPRSCFDLGLPVRSIHSVDAKDDEEVKDQEAEFMKPNISSEESSLTADKMVLDNMKVISLNSMISVEKKTSISSAGAKRKHRKIRNADDGEQEADTEAKFSQKKIKAERNSQTKKDQALKYVLEEPRPVSRRSISMDSKLKGVPEHENGPTDIMDLVRGTERRSLEQQQNKRSSVVPPGERETASGLRLKKIMRRAGDDKDSSVLVQELRKKIREAVRNKSSKEAGQNLFDPKLLDAFRAALAGSGTENRKPALDVKAKKSMLQKGKVRESLTRKIYGAGGKRKRAWTRECEVEFWKHRCHKTSKPEKIQTLKSVLDLLRDDSDKGKKVPKNEEEQTGSVLSRLYLADTSVFPRKNDIVPVSALNAVATPEHKGEGTLKEKISESSHIDHPVRIPAKNISVTQVIVPPIYSKGMRKSAKDLRVTSQKEPVSKPDITKGDKRKWALELLARKTAIPGKNGHENEEDNAIPKGNYPLLAHLPKDMRPVLAPSRHNKIPMSVRQAQLYRLTEHFLRKANLSEVCKTAETELAVADAVNIEKGLADRSNSKLVYVNLCSQELLRRSDNMISDRSKESNECSTSEELVDRVSEDANNSSLDLTVDEALKNAGLMSDSPPNSPNHPIEDNNHEAVLAENNEEEGPDNILEVDSHPELDIYGDFEYDLEDDDLIGTGSLKISKQPEDQKIKLVFSSLTLEKSDGALEPLVHEGMRNAEAFSGSSVLLESEHMTVDGDLTVNRKMDECLVQSSVGDGDEELSLAECEELYGPDREPIHVQYPETDLTTTGENTVNHGLTGENGDNESKPLENDSAFDSNCSISKESPMKVQKTDNAKKEKMSKSDSKRLENYDAVVKKVEAYIKEHIRPLCKSGVITVEQYRWSVGKTTEKVMKYHSKEKNANFLIKEGEKVKKLAEQYVEAAPQKAKN